jgi:hypothetical protein
VSRRFFKLQVVKQNSFAEKNIRNEKNMSFSAHNRISTGA